jgi:NitT/TauT family transport system substrate-binding protein
MSARVGLSPEEYKPLMAGTFFLGAAGNEKHFKKGDTLESIFHSSKVVDEFQIDNEVYKEAMKYEEYLDPSLAEEVVKEGSSTKEAATEK